MSRYESWGRYPAAKAAGIAQIDWRSDPPDLARLGPSVLAYGQGRSYGDTCLNDGGVLLDTSRLARFIGFDATLGVLRCEAGVTLAAILDLIVPRGWFLPVTPGTKYVSVGGAIAHDVHGKNHHRAGTFGAAVTRFELLRSSGERLVCSPEENAELYRATIGGLGLTGLILWAEFRLKRVPGPRIAMERIRFGGLEEFFAISHASDADWEYTVAWIDTLAGGSRLGRGIFIRGNHASGMSPGAARRNRGGWLRVPVDFPAFVLNPLTIRAFNVAYYRAQLSRHVRSDVDFDPFFYPLDAVQQWNRMYGRRGFLQYQCVVPYEDHAVIRDILARIARSTLGSFLAVLKTFGTPASPGMLSFPRPGVTLALDFPFRGQRLLALLEALDGIVRSSGGAVYPAKDARMSAQSFQAYFPRWREFARFVDPMFSSSFWRRVTTSSIVP